MALANPEDQEPEYLQKIYETGFIPTGSEYNAWIRQQIVNFRGGIPPKCDFCGKETPEHQLEPEEAGDWACHECLERWRKEDERFAL